MSKTHRFSPDHLKPRALKRLRQWEAMLRPRQVPLRFPEPEPPVWKPLGACHSALPFPSFLHFPKPTP